MPENLKPCPFCGGEAEFFCQRNEFGRVNPLYSVRCSLCHIGTVLSESVSKERAIADWNRRVTDND